MDPGGLTGRRNERQAIDQLIQAVRAGKSRTLILRGEPGVGKTTLLDYAVGEANGCRVARATGVQSEMELPFAAMHQLCAPMLDLCHRLPAPQREAIQTALGLTEGSTPDRFLVALGVLTLLSRVAERQPLVCIIDDEQWLDRASAQAFAFVARRVQAEGVGLIIGARQANAALGGLPEMVIEGLPEDDARSLLDSTLTGPLDARVRDQIVSETRGNPLALLELVRGLTPTELAGGFGLPGQAPLSATIEDSFGRRLRALPPDTQTLILLAAADPGGEPLSMWRAAERLGIAPEAAAPAADGGLVEFGARVRFRHPLVRSAAYRAASSDDRQAAHRALAEVIDPQLDPDVRAWHRAQAAQEPEEEVAQELERSAVRAYARGGVAAAAAFLARAAALTPEPDRRAQRLLVAARANRDAGALDAAGELLVAVDAGPTDALRTAAAEHLRGQIASMQRRGTDAARLLLSAARHLEPLNPALAREAHLEALGAAIWAADLENPGGLLEAARAARAAPPAPSPPRVVDALVDALALWFTEGHSAATSAMTRALQDVLALDVDTEELGRWLWQAGPHASGTIALEQWDAECSHALAVRQAQVARDTGALVHLQFALNLLAVTHLLAGELDTSARLFEEDRLIAVATGNPPLGNAEMTLAAWRGRETPARGLIEAVSVQAASRGLGRMVDIAAYASAVLDNGLGRHDSARDAAHRAFERDQIGYGPFVIPELAEAASKTGDVALTRRALDWLVERTKATPTDWSLGIEARVRALISEGAAADGHYRESIARLSRTRVHGERARSHLLYGEWLLGENRRKDARVQLETASEMLESMGIEAFAERASRALLATGARARDTAAKANGELTEQEAQIARLARDGLSNPEIAARLFISSRTVQYHLRKVFLKLEISSRTQLERVLPAEETPS